MSRAILITGSAGVLGSFLRKNLRQQGYPTLGIDIRGTGHDFGDILDYDHVSSLISTCQGIIHCAAISRVLDCEKQPTWAHQVNVLGTKNIVQAMQNTAHKPWIIFTSSREVYGNQSDLPVREESTLHPQNVYGQTKMQGERLLQAAQENGVHTAIIRLTNIYGSTNDIPERAIPSFVRNSLLHQSFSVVGEERQFDFLHIQDATTAILGLIPFVKKTSLEPLLLCSGWPITLGNLARKIQKQISFELSIPSSIQYLPNSTFEVNHFYGSSQRIKQYIDWSPKINLEEGLQQYINEMKEII